MHLRIGAALARVLRRLRGRGPLRAMPMPQIARPRAAPAYVELLPCDDEHDVFRRLQGPGNKILDLRRVEIASTFFDRLAKAWHAPPGMVARLAIVLDYEHWVEFRGIVGSRLGALTAREVEVELVYGQLVDMGRLSVWFECGRVWHSMPTVVAWLRTDWRVTPQWPQVLEVTARFVQATADAHEVPHLLLEIADIARVRGTARSPDEADGPSEAARYARTALSWIGDTPNSMRCRALRVLAATAIARGDDDAADIHLEAAAAIATVIEDAREGTWALIDLGTFALRAGRFPDAEATFRRALTLAPARAGSLRSTIHYSLADVLFRQAKREEATQHRELAEELAVASRRDPTIRRWHQAVTQISRDS